MHKTLSLALLITLTATADNVGIFLPSAVPSSRHLVVVDLSDASQEVKLTATTLQGLLNRQEKAELYLLLAGWDPFWLELLESEDLVDRVRRMSLEDTLCAYASHIKTCVVYDPELPATINIATMIAAVEIGVVIAPDAAFQVLLPDAERNDLRGRWTTNAEAYQWAFDTLLPRMNPRVLACYHPTACNHHVRDYLVQHKVFHFWVTSEEKANPPRADHAAELAVARQVLAATRPNIPVLGFWYSGADKGLDEYVGVGLAGEYGKITIVCDWATNLSLLGGVAVDLDGAVARYARRVDAEPPTLEQDKVYLCIDIVESGDSPSYVQTRMHEVWQDTRRGVVPVNWSLGPSVLDLMPPVAWYFYRNASPRDYLYMAISGAGYCQPYRRLFKALPEPEKAWEAYLQLTRRYLARMNCTALGLYTDAWKPFDRDKHDPVTRRFAEGVPALDAIILGMGRDDAVPPDKANYRIDGGGTPLVSHIMTRWPTDYAAKTREENITWLVEDIRAHTPESRPGFMHVMALSWVFGPSEIEEVLRQLGEDYVPLTIPQFNALFRQCSPPR